MHRAAFFLVSLRRESSSRRWRLVEHFFSLIFHALRLNMKCTHNLSERCVPSSYLRCTEHDFFFFLFCCTDNASNYSIRFHLFLFGVTKHFFSVISTRGKLSNTDTFIFTPASSTFSFLSLRDR